MQNVGTIDRIVRIVVGLALIALVFVGPQTPWGWIGVIPLATALIGFCPAYRLFGLSTCPLSPKKTA
jgi:ABC-type polysaccharide/polyol phosphate export permease